MTSLCFEQTAGSIHLKFESFPRAWGGIRFGLHGGGIDSGCLQWKAKGGTAQALFAGCALTVKVKGDTLQLKIKNTSNHAIRLGEMVVEFAPEAFSPLLEAEEYVKQFHSDVPLKGAAVCPVDKELMGHDPDPRRSYGVVVYANPKKGGALLMGVLGESDCVTSFESMHSHVSRQQQFGIRCSFEFGCDVPPGVTRQTPVLLIRAAEKPLELLKEYGRRWKNVLGAKFPKRVVGWNSWDYFGGAVSQTDVIANARALKKQSSSAVHAIIDDGWQVRWGEWQAHYRFPKGLKGLAAAIRKEGVEPGLWIAPYTMYMHCPFSFQNRECLLKTENGNPLIRAFSSGPGVLLDPTHPKVARYIRDTFKAIRAAGFRYLKLDFTQLLLMEEIAGYHDSTQTRMTMMRMALDHIRKAVGKDTYILSGTFPFEVLAGRVEAARISNDIHNFWTHIKHNAHQVACSFWMHDAIYRNDPDFLLTRTPTTSRDDASNYLHRPGPLEPAQWWTRGREATENEVQAWASAVLLSGGDIISGDNLPTLTRRGRRMTELCFAHACDGAAMPLDLFESGQAMLPPSYWLGRKGSDTLLGVFNWTDAPVVLMPPSEALPSLGAEVLEIWSGKTVNRDALTEIPLPPRSACVYRFQ